MPFGNIFGTKKSVKKQSGFRSPWIIPYFGSGDKSHLASRAAVGLKGINLIELTHLDMPVPPGFIINTDLTRYYLENGGFPDSFESDLCAALKLLENDSGRSFTDPHNPLLLSARNSPTENVPLEKGAIMNLGLNDTAVAGLAAIHKEPRFAWDCYRRLMVEYAVMVQNVPVENLENILTTYMKTQHFGSLRELSAEDWQAVIRKYKGVIERKATAPFPQNRTKQLIQSIEAMISNWKTFQYNARPGFEHKRHGDGPGDLAIIIQSMVYGNHDQNSGTGILFTRHPTNGDRGMSGHFTPNGQGNDFMDPDRTALPLTETQADQSIYDNVETSFDRLHPEIFEQLSTLGQQLEKHYRDMVSVTFCVEKKDLYILQTKRGKRTSVAALKTAIDMVNDGLIGKSEAVARIHPLSLEQLLEPIQEKDNAPILISQGRGVSPGAISGRIVFRSEAAEELSREGFDVILCRRSTNKKDIQAITVAAGLLTTEGGQNSYAAVTARSMGRPCIVNANTLTVDFENETLSTAEYTLKAGDTVTINGDTGEVFLGAIQSVQPDLSGYIQTLSSWADDYRRMKIYANTDSYKTIEASLMNGAEGIGLLKMEFMLRLDDIEPIIWQLALTTDHDKRMQYLSTLEVPLEEAIYDAIKLTGDLPVTIRLLDQPLHKFLPETENNRAIDFLAHQLNGTPANVKQKIKNLNQQSLILGLRGCRIGINFPAFYSTLIKVIFRAVRRADIDGEQSHPIHIVVPFVASMHEIRFIRDIIDRSAELISLEHEGQPLRYLVGTMIEVPRATMRGAEIAEFSDFLSFGTNDLTQLAYGLSIDETRTFLPDYLRQQVFDYDPFNTIDIFGLGEMIHTCMMDARKNKPGIPIGICGNHGGDPQTIDFCEHNGLDYVSCEPHQVPIARLAAAQAALRYDRPNQPPSQDTD